MIDRAKENYIIQLYQLFEIFEFLLILKFFTDI